MGDAPLVALTGWGRTSPTTARLVPVAAAEDVQKALAEPGDRGAIARGLGRSYNDAATNGGGLVLDVRPADGIFELDPATGACRVGAGTSIGDLITKALPHGWFPPVTPGTAHVTVGGAIAADVHGKNHHADGSFGAFVTAIELWTPARGQVTVTPTQDAALFWATVGGLGLTGVILEATLRLRPVSTSLMMVDTDRVADVDELMAVMEGEDERYVYSVAWIDCQVGGRRLGRSVLSRARHAEVADLPAGHPDPLRLASGAAVPTPPWVPPGLVNRWTVRAFNELWYRKAPRRRRDELQPHASFFYPLDRVRAWNRLYGATGFIQYQFVVPPSAADTVRRALEMLAAWDAASFLAVLKRFGDGTAGHLSFPTKGWTLALDLPVGRDGLGSLLDELDTLVLSAGGRVYLAKDGRVHPSLIPEMYPRLAEWRDVRDSADPEGVLDSDLDRRLDLTGRGVRA